MMSLAKLCDAILLLTLLPAASLFEAGPLVSEGTE
jgi:hypothetical protein